MSVETSNADVTERAYNALHDRALIVDRSTRLRMYFTGEKAADSLTGLVTSDVLALAPGNGQYSVALTPKGKVIADLRIFLPRAGTFLVDTNAAAAPGFVGMIRKFVNPRLAKYEDVSAQSGDFGLFGRGAAELLRGALGDEAVPGDAPYSSTTITSGGEQLLVARVPD